MPPLDRIIHDPGVRASRARIRDTGVVVGMVVPLFATGLSIAEILKTYPNLEEEDIRQAIAYYNWRVEQRGDSTP